MEANLCGSLMSGRRLCVQVKLHWLILVPIFAKKVLVMPSCSRPGVAILAAALFVAPVVSAFDAPLSAEAIREAYFLGERRDERTALFFENYRRYMPAPKSGPHVYMVEVLTPFAIAVDVSRNNWAGYSAQQAEAEYRLRGDFLRLGVQVRYTATYNQVRGTGTWKDFQVRLTQNGKSLQPRNVRYEGTHNMRGVGRGGGGSIPTGFIIRLEYDASNVTSTDAAVEIDTPDGQYVIVPFDLWRFR